MEQKTQNTALLVMDMQVGIIASFAQGSQELISANKKAIEYARVQNMPVIFVTVGFRQGAPEVSGNNKSFAAAKERFANIDMNMFASVIPELDKKADELQVMKRRISAFAGSDLEVILRAWGIQHLVLTGIATSGVVLSTLREAADKDYGLTVLADCCADADEEVHRVLTTKIFPRQADVMTVAEWIG
ncbi:MAG: cysteine hydrolase [Bacteroidetes bacterium]|nr:cysteine hydrolase [Bacteroidota bacterium]